MRPPHTRLHPQADVLLYARTTRPGNAPAALAQIVRINASRPVNKQMPAAKAAGNEYAAVSRSRNHLKTMVDSSGRQCKSSLCTLA
jgi:hypothetical protein